MKSTLTKHFIKKVNFSYLKILKDQINDCRTILDLGCGSESPLYNLNFDDRYTVGIDIFQKYLEISKKKNIHDKYYNQNILNIDDLYSENRFDCVLLLEVIEHLNKSEFFKLLKKVEKIAIKKIIVKTPNGYFSQGEYDQNKYQKHKSGWDTRILNKMGFNVYGIDGFKAFRGERGKFKYTPIKIYSLTSIFFSKILKYLPQISYQLFCVKKLK